MLLKDHEKSLAMSYKDSRSHITVDNREILAGEDWIARKKELWHRGKGKCEWPGCTKPMCDAHHVVPRRTLRNDDLRNLLGLCREHHNSLDKRKPRLRWLKPCTSSAK